jgi:hypothetical protein
LRDEADAWEEHARRERAAQAETVGRLPDHSKTGAAPHGHRNDANNSGVEGSRSAAFAKKESATSAAEPVDREAGLPEEEKTQKERRSAATRLAALVNECGLEFFHDEQGEAFVALPRQNGRETLRVSSSRFRDWLARAFYESAGTTAGGQAIEDSIRTLKGRARFDGPEHPVFLRLGRAGDRIYLDLANEAWEAVEIDRDGWRVVTPPVRFRRARSTRALPRPERGGSLEELWALVNVPEEARALVAGYLVSTLRPEGPYFALVVQGEQGSAKSSLVRTLRSLVDPAKPALRSVPRNKEDLAIAANNTWIVALDNLSGVPEWLADALCRLATGGGLGKRELYTDDDETVIDVTRPTILNGIPMLTDRHDLADRAIVLSIPPIPEERRRAEGELERALEAARPRILGVLLDAASRALRDRDEVRVGALPRMADATLWITAAEPALGFARGTFLELYSANRREAVEVGLEGDPVANAIRGLLGRGSWKGIATDLLDELRAFAPDGALKGREWPASARSLADRLRRLAPALRAVGIETTEAREGKDRRRSWTLRRGAGSEIVRCVRQEDRGMEDPTAGRVDGGRSEGSVADEGADGARPGSSARKAASDSGKVSATTLPDATNVPGGTVGIATREASESEEGSET